MPVTYCPSCGAGTKFELSAPKFCSQCGGNFSNVAVASSPAPAPAPRIVAPKPARKPLVAWQGDDDDYDEGDDQVDIRIPKKLSVSFEVDKPQRPSLGSLMQGSETSVAVEKGKRMSKRALKERVEGIRNKLNTTQYHEIGGNGRED